MSSFMKNLLVLLITLVPIFAWGKDIRLEFDGNTVSAYENMPPPPELWKATLSNGFPRDCIYSAMEKKGTAIPCTTRETLRIRFDIKENEVLRDTLKTDYSVIATDSGLTITSSEPIPKTESEPVLNALMVYCVGIGILVVSAINGWRRGDWMRAFAFYGAILGCVVISGFAGGFAGETIGWFIGMVAGGLIGWSSGFTSQRINEVTSIHAGIVASISAGMVASMAAGALAGGLAGNYGWVDAGITEYLFFLGGACLISFLIRGVVAFVSQQVRRPIEKAEA